MHNPDPDSTLNELIAAFERGTPTVTVEISDMDGKLVRTAVLRIEPCVVEHFGHWSPGVVADRNTSASDDEYSDDSTIEYAINEGGAVVGSLGEGDETPALQWRTVAYGDKPAPPIQWFIQVRKDGLDSRQIGPFNDYGAARRWADIAEHCPSPGEEYCILSISEAAFERNQHSDPRIHVGRQG